MNLSGQTCVVTGASSGIGLALAEALAGRGFRLLLSGRDRARLAEAAGRARRCGVEVVELVSDVSTIEGTKALAERILTEAPRLDVLIHNAGVLPTERVLTSDGFEVSFAVNHLAPFLLNHLLRGRLVASGPARVVQVSAGLYVAGKVDLEQGPLGLPFHPFATYGSSKLWNLLATLELARELEGSGVTVNAVHPGVIRTRLGDLAGVKGALLGVVKRFWGSPEKGARGPLYLATSADLAGVTGRYYDQLRPRALKPIALEPGLGRAVVERSRALLKLG